MAYNVLKGAVEGSVDQYADQEIDGIKIFKNTISASVFYDTDAQSPCATMKDVALVTLNGTTENSILTLTGEKTATANYNLTFKDGTMRAPYVEAESFAGSAAGLNGIRADKIVGLIGAENIAAGPGLRNVRNILQVDTTHGISVGDEGIKISLGIESGLSVIDGHLTINAEKSSQINTAGQNLSDGDLILVSDVSKGKLHSTTMANLYDGYLKLKTPQPSGPTGALQLRGADGFDSSNKLKYDASVDTLTVDGKINAAKLEVGGTLITSGAVYGNISKVTSEIYEVAELDYTILCDSHDNPIIVMLPAACNNTGRIITVKKTNTDKYNIRSHPVAIKTAEGTIDLNSNMILKTNYSTRTLQSDGENWWVIGAKGN
jgi:hypothetical protein